MNHLIELEIGALSLVSGQTQEEQNVKYVFNSHANYYSCIYYIYILNILSLKWRIIIQ